MAEAAFVKFDRKGREGSREIGFLPLLEAAAEAAVCTVFPIGSSFPFPFFAALIGTQT